MNAGKSDPDKPNPIDELWIVDWRQALLSKQL
jgi:hypothetical protein